MIFLQERFNGRPPRSPQSQPCDFRNETILGDRTRHRAITTEPSREWLIGSPFCAALAEYSILHLGIVEAVQPYRFVRQTMLVTTFLVCLNGEGRIFSDGNWVPWRGQAALLPMHSATAYEACGTEPWELVCVCYTKAVATLSSPVVATYEPQALFHTVEALREECQRESDLVCIRALMAAIHRFVMRFVEAGWQDNRLTTLWQKVAADLSAEWTLDRLTAAANICEGSAIGNSAVVPCIT